MSSLSRHGFTFHRPGEADMEELAAAVRLEQKVSPGIGFARKSYRVPSRPEKNRARAKAGTFCADICMPWPIRVLTLPGLKWPFERMLLSSREHHKPRPRIQSATTELWAFEWDAAIFRSSLHWMPGRPITGVGKTGVSTPLVAHYEYGDVDAFLRTTSVQFDMAWLDYSGPLIQARWDAIHRFFRQNLRQLLTLTFERARSSWWADVEHDGKPAEWLAQELCATRVDNLLSYNDPTPMFQVTLWK